jgi:hypothetical protein
MARHIQEKTKIKQKAQTTKAKLEKPQEDPLHTCKLPLDECMQTT